LNPLNVHLEAIAFTCPLAADWSELCAKFNTPRAARRLSPQILLALAIAEQIAPSLSEDAGWVFASSIGEGETLQVILEALRDPEMMVQPLRFQNAVHNAASGQWTIAAGLKGPTTSIGAYGETVGAGFLKSAMQVVLEQRSVGLVLYDAPLPDPLHEVHPIDLPMGAAFALTPKPGPNTVVSLELIVTQNEITPPRTEISQKMIETLNPISAVMPLLENIVGLGDNPVSLGLHGGSTLQLSVKRA